MINLDAIKDVARRIGEAANADRVILFGSYARGQATENSDVDFLVVADSDLPPFKRSRKLYGLFKPYPFAMDIFVYTPQEIEKESKCSLSFASTVLHEGKILYARRN
ncbi:MAG: nucleotidyltransferase domain-containing protein [Sedimentisphaerales bacterium]|nr:nucleotidyltransferase domain-containing protein [Sedimentisphaerales bacterium]